MTTLRLLTTTAVFGLIALLATVGGTGPASGRREEP